tara:strand:+ start:38 stop:202 length:165 start_codon:yes stop_codon:yes gene_type:complete
MTGMINLRDSEPEQLELFVEEEEPIPTWGEIVRDPESMFILFSLIAVVALMIFW